MDLTKPFTEDRAVSPVIAVVLMIAVTVILAAIVAAFALGLGGGARPTPQVSLGFGWDDGGTVGGSDDTLVITHEGGDSLPAAQVDVLVNGAADTSASWRRAGSVVTTVVTGSRYTIDEADAGTDVVNAGDEIRVVWTEDDGRGATLGLYEIPA